MEDVEETNKCMFLEKGAEWLGSEERILCVVSAWSCFKRRQLGILAVRGVTELQVYSGEHEPWVGAWDDEPPCSWVKPFQSGAICSHQSLAALSRARLHFSVLIS